MGFLQPSQKRLKRSTEKKGSGAEPSRGSDSNCDMGTGVGTWVGTEVCGQGNNPISGRQESIGEHMVWRDGAL